MSGDDADLLLMGRISGVYGLRGWLKVFSYASPREGILDYPEWYLRMPQGWQKRRLAAGRIHGKGVVAHLQGCDDRDAALMLLHRDVAVPRDALPELGEDEYYWHQLQGLSVYARRECDEPLLLGEIAYLMDTGANDVMVLEPRQGSVDQRERLLPWLPGKVVLEVDLAAGRVLVDWDPDF